MKSIFLFLSLSLLALPACEKDEPLKISSIERQHVKHRYDLARDTCASPEEGMSYNDCICEEEIAYPQAIGKVGSKLDALNAALKEPVKDAGCPAGVKVKSPPAKDEVIQQHSVDYKVTFESEKLLSVQYGIYSYTGGAHGNNAVGSRTVNLHTGKLYNLNDLVADENRATLEIHRQLRDMEEGVVFDAVRNQKALAYIQNGQCHDCVVGLSPQGLTVTFQTYAVSPYSSGNIEVALPPTFIKDPEIRAEIEKKK